MLYACHGKRNLFLKRCFISLFDDIVNSRLFILIHWYAIAFRLNIHIQMRSIYPVHAGIHRPVQINLRAVYTADRTVYFKPFFLQLRRQRLLQPIVDDLNNLGRCHPHKVRIPPLYFLEPMRFQRFLKRRFKTLVHFQCSHFSFSHTTDVRYLLSHHYFDSKHPVHSVNPCNDYTNHLWW